MTASSRGLLADVYLAWMDKTYLSQAQIGRFSGIAPSVLARIAKGITQRPTERTLDRIALAFGRHPRRNDVRNREYERQSRRELYRAAGYADPENPADYVSLFDTGLMDELGDAELVAAWKRRIRALRHLSPEEVEWVNVAAPSPSGRRRPRAPL